MAEVRRHPNGRVQARLLHEYSYRCAYCTLPFGALAYTRRTWVITSLEWDHFVPYALLGRNPDDNWVPACNICNRLKSSYVFKDLVEARDAILTRWHEKDYAVMWVPQTSSEDDRDRWHAEYLERDARHARGHSDDVVDIRIGRGGQTHRCSSCERGAGGACTVWQPHVHAG